MQTIERINAIFDCFTLERPELGVREAARLIGLSTSTTGRMLAAMKELGILTQNPTTHTYALGGKVLKWAGVYSETLDVRARSIPMLEELHRSTQETISLYVMEGNERVCVERLESPQNVRIVARVGRRLPLYAGSAGKVFLAFLPEARREEIIRHTEFKPLTSNTIVDEHLLRDELAKIRRQGYSLSRGEWLSDAAGVAAPVFDQSGLIVAAVTISGPAQRFTEEKVNQYIPEILHVGEQISRYLGYLGRY